MVLAKTAATKSGKNTYIRCFSSVILKSTICRTGHLKVTPLGRKVLFGEQENVDWNKADIDWNAIDSQLISRRIAVTRNRVNGVKLGSLRFATSTVSILRV